MSVRKQKKRQGSKKTKKSWRKTDIQDVEDFLEDKRLEERLGASFNERADEDLFVLDTKPDDKNLEVYENTKKQQREEIIKKPPRCFQILESYTKVPDPVIKRNRVRLPEERKHPLLRKKEEDRRKQGVLKAKERESLRDRKLDDERRRNKPTRDDFSKDLWDEDVPSNKYESQLKSQWLDPSVQHHVLSNMGCRQKPVPDTLKKKPYVLPAVEAPHPGMSYNPSFTDHQELLQAIASKESELIKEEKHLKRVTTLMFKKVPRATAEREWIKEMSEGVPSLDPAASVMDEDDGCNNEFCAINPPTDREKKKNLKVRRKAREEMKKRSERLRAKEEQKKISDLYRVKKLQEELSKADDKSATLQRKRLLKKAARVAKTKRLGCKKFEETELEFNLGSELKGTLCGLKPQGNLLADRFVSLQKRNVMEVATKQNPRRAKTKKFLKASHKMAWEANPMQRSSRQKRKQQSTVLGVK